MRVQLQRKLIQSRLTGRSLLPNKWVKASLRREYCVYITHYYFPEVTSK